MGSKINRGQKATKNTGDKKHPLVELFNKYSNIISIGLTAILVVFVAFTILKTIRNNKEMEAATIYDQAMITFQEARNYQDAEPEIQKQVMQEQQRQSQNLDSMIKTHSGTLAATRARLFFAQFYYQQAYYNKQTEYFKQAETLYIEAIANEKRPFYLAIANLGLAQTYEQLNDYTQAFEHYEKVTRDYKGQGFNPISIVGMARCKEMQGDTASAKMLYAQVAEQYPDSQWSQFARGKVYFYSEAAMQQKAPANTLPTQNQLLLPQ